MTSSRGFTLIEMAIVLVIITILIGGLAVPLSAQIQARRIAETQKTLGEAQEAIIGFAIANTCTINCINSQCDLQHHSCSTASCNDYCSKAVAFGWPSSTQRHFLPCPDINNDGIEDRTGESCTQPQGNIPWVTLGAASQDAWGNRLQYSVTDGFANRSLGFKNGDAGTNQICNSAAGGCASGNLATNVPVVVLSYGPNGRGATSIYGTSLAASVGIDEQENALTDADQQYVSHTPYKPADGSATEAAKEFDDLVIWIPTTLLTTRVCPAGGCL